MVKGNNGDAAYRQGRTQMVMIAVLTLLTFEALKMFMSPAKNSSEEIVPPGWASPNNGANVLPIASSAAAAPATLVSAMDLPDFTTPGCMPHPTNCGGLCKVVGDWVRKQRDGTQSNPESWSFYYPTVSKYYTCSKAKIIVEVGAAWGSQTQYILKHNPEIKEYHVVDPFLAGYDKDDPMSNQFMQAAPNATSDAISQAWGQAMAKALGVDGEYLNGGMEPAGCKLRIHRLLSTEGAKLFGKHSVDVVFIDGLHTYEGVVDDIRAWRSKVKLGGALIFNDYSNTMWFPGISKAVAEEARRQNTEIRMIDATNAVLGGSKECASLQDTFQQDGSS